MSVSFGSIRGINYARGPHLSMDYVWEKISSHVERMESAVQISKETKISKHYIEKCIMEHFNMGIRQLYNEMQTKMLTDIYTNPENNIIHSREVLQKFKNKTFSWLYTNLQKLDLNKTSAIRNDALSRIIPELMKKGYTVQKICKELEIGEKTFYKWMRKNHGIKKVNEYREKFDMPHPDVQTKVVKEDDREFFANALASGLTVKQIAKLKNKSEAQIRYRIEQYNLKTPKQILKENFLKQAAKRAINTPLKVIADAVGINYSHAAELFREHFKMTLSEFRKQQKELAGQQISNEIIIA